MTGGESEKAELERKGPEHRGGKGSGSWGGQPAGSFTLWFPPFPSQTTSLGTHQEISSEALVLIENFIQSKMELLMETNY